LRHSASIFDPVDRFAKLRPSDSFGLPTSTPARAGVDELARIVARIRGRPFVRVLSTEPGRFRDEGSPRLSDRFLFPLAFEFLLLVPRLQRRVIRLTEHFVLSGVSIEAGRLSDFRCKTIVGHSFAHEALEIRIEVALAGTVEFLRKRGKMSDFVVAAQSTLNPARWAKTPCTTMMVRPLPSKNG
jgi:hypothetical protein